MACAAAIAFVQSVLAASILLDPRENAFCVALERSGSILGGLAALRGGHTLGLPLLAPWANRLCRRCDRSGRVSVDLAGLLIDAGPVNSPVNGAW